MQEKIINPTNTFFFSDPHFGHRNIIEYCHRPFKDVDEMNEVILQRYNETVRDDSLVFFVGDMSFGRGSLAPKLWLSILKGSIIYIKGSHDHGIRPTNLSTCFHRYHFAHAGIHFQVAHIPTWESIHGWSDWLIHGHTHSTVMLDKAHHKICVCVEATDYRPVSLEKILEAIK